MTGQIITHMKTKPTKPHDPAPEICTQTGRLLLWARNWRAEKCKDCGKQLEKNQGYRWISGYAKSHIQKGYLCRSCAKGRIRYDLNNYGKGYFWNRMMLFWQSSVFYMDGISADELIKRTLGNDEEG